MIITTYDKRRNYDVGISFILKSVRNAIYEKKDDFMLLLCGYRGTGKSTLGLHIMEEFLGEDASVDYIGLNPSDFATALKKTKESPLPRLCNNDEGNLSKQEWQSRYSKDLIDLYYSIRGTQIFHLWSNPSLDIINKRFIEDIVKGVIFIANKDKGRPRIYYYFRKRDLLKMWEKYGNLSLQLLKRVSKEYAYYKGWFRDYNGFLLKDYELKKTKRMGEKIDTFFENYGNDDFIKREALKKKLGISEPTFIRWERHLEEEKIINKKNRKVTLTGYKSYSKELIEEFKKCKGLKAKKI